jgi:hypothetical protein
MATYTPNFRHTPWSVGSLSAELPPGNSPNDVMARIAAEFRQIAASYNSLKEVGLVVVSNISDGARIPVPAGFALAETRFFAFIKTYSQNDAQRVLFSVFANTNNDGTVLVVARTGHGVNATGVAIARRGGW